MVTFSVVYNEGASKLLDFSRPMKCKKNPNRQNGGIYLRRLNKNKKYSQGKILPLSFDFLFSTYNIKFAILAIIKCTVQCYELCLHYCATTTNHLFPKLFITPSRKLIPPLHPKLVSRHSSASSTMSHLKMLHKGLKMFPYFCGIYHCGRLRCVRLTLWKLLLPLG